MRRIIEGDEEMVSRLLENETASSQIEHLARERIEVFKGSIRADGTYKDPIYRSARSTGLQLASDFGRRFLVELIQNAYDAHERKESAGEIRILFSPGEGPNGTLYIGNRGNGFRWSNVEALCSIGLSDKPVGESIGNKGLGFRSVLYVSAEPQIFSRLTLGPANNFDGYCFRFAGPGDFHRWIEDPVQRSLAERDLPPFHIPIPVTDYSNSVNAFARDGFATVIRLPLQSLSARNTVRDEIEALRNSPAPILLFLRRLSTLELVVDGEPEHSFCLTRLSEVIHLRDEAEKQGNEYTCVKLGGAQRYLVAWHWVPEEQVKRAIDSSIQQKLLHQSWSDWQGPGELAVALRMDEGSLTPLLYTFLPMGDEAEAPFHGYLHSSFYPKADRTSLHADIPINVLYIRKAIRLCASTIMALRHTSEQSGTSISQEEAGKLIVDLMCWKQVRSIESEDGRRFPALMREAFTEIGCSFAKTAVLPIVPRCEGVCWARPDEIWRWDHTELKMFGVDAMVALADVAILPPGLGTERLDRLASFIDKADDDLSLAPAGEDIADAIERISSALWQSKASTDKWANFYLELKPVLEGKSMNLNGRKILLCKDGMLRPATMQETHPIDPDSAAYGSPKRKGHRRRKPNDVAVFSPSKRYMGESLEAQNASEVLQLPAELSEGIAFLTDELEWYDELETARHFLEETKLVRAYDGEELVAHVSSVIRNDSRAKVRRAALAWVFRLYRASQSSRPISLRRARLFVPTLDGQWIDARDAIFSVGWPANTLGDLTDNFLAQAATHADELRLMRDRRLASPDKKPFSDGQTGDWVNFLTAIRVKRGLQPIRRETRNFRITGSISATGLCERLGIGETTLGYWQRDIEQSDEKQTYPSSQHELDGSLWYMPGQEQHASFSAEAGVLFAQLILNWLATADPEYLRTAFFAPTFQYASRFHWPTPLAAFLRQAAWFPVEISDGVHSRWQFQKPMCVWLPNEEETGLLPPYMPQIPRDLRRTISEQMTVVEPLREWCDANFLNASVSLSRQADFLGRLFESPGLDRYYLKSFTNLYYDTWRRLAAEGATLDWHVEGQQPHYLVTRKSGRYAAVAVHLPEEGDANENDSAGQACVEQDIFVRDTDDTLAIVLMEAIGFHVFDAGVQNAAGVADLLRDLLGSRFRALSDVKILFLIDGEKFVDRVGEDDFAVNQCPWLPTLVCLAMESLTGAAAQRLPADRGEILDRLHRIQLRLAETVKFQVNESVVDLPASHYGTLAFGDKNHPTLIIVAENGSLDWSAMRRAATPLSHLLEHTDLARPLQIAFLILEGVDEPVSGPLPANTRLVDLCRELHVDPNAAVDALEVLGSNIRRLTRLLRPVVHYFKGASGVDTFTSDTAHAKTIPDLTNALVPNVAGTGYAVETVLTACQRAVDFGGVRDELNLSFGEFNESLNAVNEEPDIHREAHIEAVSTFVADHRNAIMDSLRHPFVESFRGHLSLKAYLGLRAEVDQIAPEEEWLLRYKIPKADIIRSLVDKWLTQNAAPGIGLNPTGLPFWSEVRRDNKSQVKRFAQTYGNTIRAWCHKEPVDPPEPWTNPMVASDQLFTILDNLGALDFELLNEKSLIAWFAEAGAWPTKMLATIALADLCLTATEVDDERVRERTAKREREKEARSIEFNGRIVDPHEIDPDVLASEIKAKLAKEIAATKLGQVVDLRHMPDRKKGRGSGTRKVGRSGGLRKINSDKADLIGFLGECTVYYWLNKQYPQQDIDAAWVSGYRSRLLPGDGDDGLGYDFDVRYRKQHWHLEVKSSIGDPQEFELAESEVRFARDCVRKRGCEYQIVYVSNLYDTLSTRVELLPNPMSEEGRRHFQIGGQGLRYKFTRGR